MSKTMRVDATGSSKDGDLIYNKLRVTLESSETVSLEGKYIYQISIKENTGKVEVPSQGILYITNNINKQYVSGQTVTPSTPPKNQNSLFMEDF